MILLQVTGIRKQVASGTFHLHPISFTQQQGQKLAVAGATGSGKSTLLRIIAGLEQPDGGEVRFEGAKVKGPDYRLIPGEPGIGYLSQHYELRNHYRMEELLGYADTLPDGQAERLFRLCRIDHLLQRKTDQLSGGERQRIALARLLLTGPRLLLLDEPFSNLDRIHKSVLKEVLDNIAAATGLSFIIASHDPTDLLPWADELLILRDGHKEQQDTPEAIYHRPLTEYAGALLGDYNLLADDMATALGLAPQAGRRYFVRPEQLQITASGATTALRGIITGHTFYGACNLVNVSVDGHELKVWAPAGNIQSGSEVGVLLKGDAWLLPDAAG